MLSLRGQWVVSAAVLGGLALVGAAALIGITSYMERSSNRLWEASESVRAAEELEVALLLHSRERRMLALTGEEAHARALKDAEVQLRRWLKEAWRHQGGGDEEALLAQLDAEVGAYLEAVRQEQERQAPPPTPGSGFSSIERSVGFAERLVDLNVTDARGALAEVQRLNRTADVLGLLAGVLLLAGAAGVLWSFQWRVYRPLEDIRHALASFQLGGATTALPEQGAAELRDIVRHFNDMAARLARQREVQLAFLAAVAHDLRNPLTALKLATASKRQEPGPGALDVVRRQVARLERMVEDLLDTARVEAGQLELRVGEHDVVELVRESVELHRSVSQQHPIETHLPEAPLLLPCDATRLTQVLNNLLGNAIKYSPEGGPVKVRLERERDGASLSVTDVGIGIPESELQSIFEPFRRSPRTRGVIPGVGLGLSVARRIVEAHGGRLEVTSREGHGSTFRVWLRAAPPGR